MGEKMILQQMAYFRVDFKLLERQKRALNNSNTEPDYKEGLLSLLDAVEEFRDMTVTIINSKAKGGLYGKGIQNLS